MRHNPRVPFRKPLAAALLLLAVAAMPQWLWLGAHALGDHGHAGDAAGHGTEWSGLAKALVHGHQHSEGVPDHEHHLLPSPPLRQDPPRDLQAPGGMAFLEAPDTGHLLLSAAHPLGERTTHSGSSPPRLHLLCVLLI
ncbi:MAG TPA: hypothetical protein VE685_01865 [Thermoanaerobaculia bacterium]|nr:hypothetical protein [Thermoanaerobaculia bacterium]